MGSNRPISEVNRPVMLKASPKPVPILYCIFLLFYKMGQVGREFE